MITKRKILVIIGIAVAMIIASFHAGLFGMPV